MLTASTAVTKQRKCPWSTVCFKEADPIFAACETYISHCKSGKLKDSKNKVFAMCTLLYSLYHACNLPREKSEKVKNLEIQILQKGEIPKLKEQNFTLIKREEDTRSCLQTKQLELDVGKIQD